MLSKVDRRALEYITENAVKKLLDTIAIAISRVVELDQ
jgi:hypothetical protein